ncbi:DUF1835 domain-containing protein [Algoriphagus formosus]|uniref:DUF1835 domain-containing protein n=1 Tax=Algoriphagus formosus TaxID=2007308 RepID=UPI000C282166|nr:DUF1835 domain-containing protein [Algoriphagus formosus]
MTLHILNGDSLAEQLPKEIPGKKIIFRECLIDGPVAAKTENEFWKLRKDFLEKNYGAEDYDIYSKSEILKITQIQRESAVYLWFEEDLFCQVNLWKAISLLPDEIELVYLVIPGKQTPYSFAHLNSKQLRVQWKNPIKIDFEDQKLFKTLWKSFQSADTETASLQAQLGKEKFPFLNPALDAWKAMIPSKDSEGLPLKTLKEIQAAHPDWGFGKTFQEFQKRHPIYGFGDLQVHRFWESLKKGA